MANHNLPSALTHYSRQPGKRAGVLWVVKVNVPITSPGRSGMTWRNAGQRSAQSSVDNCFRDQAVTNAGQLADLLSSTNVPLVTAEP
jgi:hypothetical protein